MILLVSSNKDIASINIRNQILNHYTFEKQPKDHQGNPIYEANLDSKKITVVTINSESVHAQNITDFSADLELIVFISRHSSLSGTPTLSVHTPGNLGEAQLGGLPKTVSISPANAMKDVLKAMMRLKEEMQLEYEVSYECTHHGPSVNVPTMFTELGSSPKQWNDLKAAEAVAISTMEAISKFGKSHDKTVLGIGGPHYSEKFTRLAIKSATAFGHIIPKYAIPHINSEILAQCIKKTLEKVESAVLDWKGIKGEDKPKLAQMLEQLGIFSEKV